MPTLWQRRHLRDRILSELIKQVFEYNLAGQVEVVLYEDGGEASVGKKRQLCLESCRGEYVCCLDDDDMVAPNYLSEILLAIEKCPDVVTFDGEMTRNGETPKDFHIGLDVKQWDFRHNIYYRPPHHLTPVKRSIAELCKYKDWQHGEDSDFGKQIGPHLKTSVHIAQKLYFYEWVEKAPANPKDATSSTRLVRQNIKTGGVRGNRPQRAQPTNVKKR